MPMNTSWVIITGININPPYFLKRMTAFVFSFLRFKYKNTNPRRAKEAYKMCIRDRFLCTRYTDIRGIGFKGLVRDFMRLFIV